MDRNEKRDFFIQQIKESSGAEGLRLLTQLFAPYQFIWLWESGANEPVFKDWEITLKFIESLPEDFRRFGVKIFMESQIHENWNMNKKLLFLDKAAAQYYYTDDNRPENISYSEYFEAASLPVQNGTVQKEKPQLPVFDGPN